MNIIKVLIEFVITFAIVYTIYYLVILRRCKKNHKMVPTEVNLILHYYDINIKNINLYQMTKVVSLVTTIILSVIITIISIFFDNTIILLIFGALISILIAIICYRFIGSYYEKKSNEIGNKKNNKKEKSVK